ncbi:MAG TPA: DUF4430 domain-containing protein [Gaiellaceae bacterium]|nr:DUF4430 domain-containing protein [Gaiellaceae bacterium]
MQRSLCTLAALLALAAVFASTAAAASVSVRVEGKTMSIFGASEPRVSADNAMGALDIASLLGEFYYHVTTTSFGPYVDQIGRYPAGGANGWVFKVNGASPPVGADKVTLKDGDRVLWYYATFGPGGGPPTLLLTRTRRNCYRVVSEDDAGADTPGAGAVLRVDGRRVRTAGGRGCVGNHKGLVRATLTGAVRSNALR